MEQGAVSSPLHASTGFAGLLASLTSSAAGADDHATSWDDSALDDDVVSLSSGGTHGNYARCRLGTCGDWPESQNDEADRDDGERPFESATSRDLRTASITIWMTKTERARMRRRATESGMTISAYLRSCALEAELLREQVKAALAALKSAAKTETAAVPARRPWWGCLGRIRKRKK
jgi:hypothetical protein